LIHIAPWRVAEGLFAGAGRYLLANGRLFLYGPFKRGGEHTAPSNAAFDKSLRDNNPEWGVRDIDDLQRLAASAGLKLIEIAEMHNGSGPTNLLAVFCANVIHIAPWRVAEGLFAGAGRYLQTGGRLFLYGPFKRGGKQTAPSNAAFDQSLRAQDGEWGVRDIEDLEKLAANAGLKLVEIVEMPANNLTLVFERSKRSS